MLIFCSNSRILSKIVSFHICILSGTQDLTYLFCAEFISHVKVFVNFVTRQGYSYLCVFAPAVPNPQNKKWKLGKWTIYFSVPLKVEDACAYFVLFSYVFFLSGCRVGLRIFASFYRFVCSQKCAGQSFL